MRVWSSQTIAATCVRYLCLKPTKKPISSHIHLDSTWTKRWVTAIWLQEASGNDVAKKVPASKLRCPAVSAVMGRAHSDVMEKQNTEVAV
jgi:hypothetical protein